MCRKINVGKVNVGNYNFEPYHYKVAYTKSSNIGVFLVAEFFRCGPTYRQVWGYISTILFSMSFAGGLLIGITIIAHGGIFQLATSSTQDLLPTGET